MQHFESIVIMMYASLVIVTFQVFIRSQSTIIYVIG